MMAVPAHEPSLLSPWTYASDTALKALGIVLRMQGIKGGELARLLGVSTRSLPRILRHFSCANVVQCAGETWHIPASIVQDVQRTLDAEWEKRAEERTNAKHAKKPALPGRNG